MARRRAFLLVESLAALLVASLMIFLLCRMLVDGMQIERLTSERMQRRAATDSFLDRLRADAMRADSFEWGSTEDAFVLTLFGAASLPQRDVAYNFLGGDVTRTANGMQTDGWKAPRLLIEAAVRSEHRRALLDVNVVELPPARKRDARPRETHSWVNLPARRSEETR
ncbi:MAG: hypothetical protein ACKVS9_14520 [Phycisphaerae bacterium]